ncbi:hypothetical protein FEM48_Zijuj01G0315400 [Ziziphus jujuba var. spinosa]|uniref:Protein kinase domain-containing protein n=1 Tax=Ziziphus jujuba var. spinosa TaxID=714518 RepID=A0A978W6A4_ZIZJJ|nr:hypothetical protein FEM48_Zijuj01G0315400 [Ziziphus jujuba var. spinosa]
MLRRFKNSECKTKESFYLNNGAALLEQMIICFNGKCNPIRIYSENGLKDATIDFHDNRELHRDWNYNLYKDDHGNGQFLVKKFKPIADPFNYNSLQLIAEEAAIALQMGKHKNVLKLLCCCLETDLPIFDELHDTCLKANILEDGNRGQLTECAEVALSYLPNMFSGFRNHKRKTKEKNFLKNGAAVLEQLIISFNGNCNPIRMYSEENLKKATNNFHHDRVIHRDFNYTLYKGIHQGRYISVKKLKPLLGLNWETHVVAGVFGTHGFAAPEVEKYGWHTEKSDVYGFGILLCEILTGKRYDALRWGSEFSDIYRRNSSNSVVESNDAWGRDLANVCAIHLKTKSNIWDEENRVQVMECAKLVERCLQTNPNDRPDMIQVAKALRFNKNIQH